MTKPNECIIFPLPYETRLARLIIYEIISFTTPARVFKTFPNAPKDGISQLEDIEPPS
jgi:hypothetical protein